MSGILDFDTTPSYSFDILAEVRVVIHVDTHSGSNNYFTLPEYQDGGNPPLNNTDTLAVTIVDALDPPPTFSEGLYTTTVEEGTYTNVL